MLKYMGVRRRVGCKNKEQWQEVGICVVKLKG
jgi:hypothetical protein